MNHHNAKLAATARIRRARILRLRGRKLTYAQIAKLEGVSKQRIAQIIAKWKRNDI
jgi:DNA-directed RNA polymerase sigma subunit (sigma70/sigma32)